MQARSFCGFCGAKYNPAHPALAEALLCNSCGNTTYVNATPVSILIQPVLYKAGEHTLTGVLVGQRGINPKLGEWCLPGGFVSPSDTSYELAALREFVEEVEFEGEGTWPDKKPTLLYSTAGDPGQIISVCVSNFFITEQQLQEFTPNLECTAVRVAKVPEQLCFASHTEALRRYLSTTYLD